MIADAPEAGYVPHPPTSPGNRQVQESAAQASENRTNGRYTAAIVIAALLLTAAAAACTPTVKVATDEPITINLNVNIRHEILVKVDRELDDLFSKDSELF